MDSQIAATFEKFIRFELYATNSSTKTVECYQNCAKLLVRFFGNISICDLDEMKIRQWHEDLQTWQKSDTARGNLSCLRKVLKFAKNHDLPVMNYENIKVPKREKRIINYLSYNEIERFIAVAGKPHCGLSKENRLRAVAITTLLFDTGLRVGEMCRLNRNTIKNRQFTVIGKSRDPRIVFITERSEKAIAEYLAVRKDKNIALFVSTSNGGRITPGTVRRIYANICERGGFVGVHPHTSRHSLATKLIRNHVDIFHVGLLLGHQDLNTTREYLHYENPELKDIYMRAMR